GAPQPIFSYQTDAAYTVKLTGTASPGTDSATKSGFLTLGAGLPVADFTGTPTSGPAPLSVQFTDTSTGGPTSWAWDFQNDGTVDSTVQNPSFTYTAAGTYSVSLKVTNGSGSNTKTKVSYISVSSNPTTPTFAPTEDARPEE